MKKNFINALAGIEIFGIIGLGAAIYLLNKSSKKANEDRKRLNSYYEVLNLWLDLKISGEDIGAYFHDKNIRTLAIYGVGELGIHLYNELKEISDLEIKYCIDNFTKDRDMFDFEVKATDELTNDDKVDAVIVTPIHQFEKIEKNLLKLNSKIISIDELFYR